MDAIRQDDVFSGITQLWPRCKMTKPEFAAGPWLRLRGYGVEVIKSTLKQHRANFLDAIRPEWKTLFRELAGDGAGTGHNEMEVLLVQLRHQLEDFGVKHVDDWTDGDVFQNHVGCNPGKEASILWRWRTYFRELGKTAPDYLVDV